MNDCDLISFVVKYACGILGRKLTGDAVSQYCENACAQYAEKNAVEEDQHSTQGGVDEDVDDTGFKGFANGAL